MHIVYTDESGLANIRKILRSKVPACSSHIEFHAYDMSQQKASWSVIPKPMATRWWWRMTTTLTRVGAVSSAPSVPAPRPGTQKHRWID